MKQIDSRGHWLQLSKAEPREIRHLFVRNFMFRLPVFKEQTNKRNSRLKLRWTWEEHSVRSCGPESGLLQALHIWFLLCYSCYALWDMATGPSCSSCRTFSCCIDGNARLIISLSLTATVRKWILQVAVQCFRDLIIRGCAHANAQIFYSPCCAFRWYHIQLSLY